MNPLPPFPPSSPPNTHVQYMGTEESKHGMEDLGAWAQHGTHFFLLPMNKAFYHLGKGTVR